MKKTITKAMVLAAGLGTRLRPLTCKTPKPLIEVGGKKIIEYGLEMLKAAGVKDVTINLHHLPETIREYLGDGSKYGLNISYSDEQEILGTGGGIKKVESFFGDEPFLVINSDILTDINLKKVIESHYSSGAEATMVVRPLGKGEAYTSLNVAGGQLVGFGTGEYMFMGIQILTPSLLSRLPLGVPSDIVTACYMPMLESGRKIATYIHDGYWTEIGTHDKLEEVRDLIAADGLPFLNL